jgi:hypothetical protein
VADLRTAASLVEQALGYVVVTAFGLSALAYSGIGLRGLWQRAK